MKVFRAIALAIGCLVPCTALAEAPADPLQSPMWSAMVAILQGVDEADIVFDDAIKVYAPAVAEDQMQVPITVDATQIGAVDKIVVLTDLNPIQHVLTYEPVLAAPYISFRVRVEQATPLRAAVLTHDGKWHVAGVNIDAAGGGCTAPSESRGQSDWVRRLVETRASIWRYANTPEARLRLRIRHPMDTGLADGIPAFFINRIEVKAPDNRILARLQIGQPVSEHPTFTLKPRIEASERFVQIQGRDTDGNLLNLQVAAPDATSSTALLH